MAKKYVPSGYQIIDLGSHDLSSSVTITDFDNDFKILYDICINALTNYPKQKIKPFLISCINSDVGALFIGQPSIVIDTDNGQVKLFLTVNFAEELIIAIETGSVILEIYGGE